MSRTPEGDIKKEIVAYLLSTYPDAVIEPLYTGTGRASRSHYRTPDRSNGRADLLMLHKSKAIALEIKVPGKKPSPDQDAWAKRWILAGGYYLVVRSIQDLLKIPI